MIAENNEWISLETNGICFEEFIVKRSVMFINFSEAKDGDHGKRPWQHFVVTQHRIIMKKKH